MSEGKPGTLQQMILAGDIGGTKTNLGLFSVQGSKLTLASKRSFSSKDYPDLKSLVREFISNNSSPVTSACFGVPCPVVGGRCETPNLAWVLDARDIANSLGFRAIALVNDLEAMAYGVSTLDADEFVILNEGIGQPGGNMALIAAGTGLGEAILYWDGRAYHPLASEGGHADFAPRSPLEMELLRYLMARFGHVSYERVASGPGLVNIYYFLKDSGYFREPPWLAEKFVLGDPSAAISEAALSGKAEICVKALDLFVSVYGAEAGNLALKAKAVRAVYIGGGIAPKIINKLKDGTFMRAFTEKGRFSDFLSRIPVHVVLNEEAALQGAAYYAAFRSEKLGR